MGIVVSSTGSLDLHGQRFDRTWTRLAAPVSPGDTTVYLQRAVNWEPGQQVLLTTTALKDARDYRRNEVLVLSTRRRGVPAHLGSAVCARRERRLAGRGGVALAPHGGAGVRRRLGAHRHDADCMHDLPLVPRLELGAVRELIPDGLRRARACNGAGACLGPDMR